MSHSGERERQVKGRYLRDNHFRMGIVFEPPRRNLPLKSSSRSQPHFGIAISLCRIINQGNKIEHNNIHESDGRHSYQRFTYKYFSNIIPNEISPNICAHETITVYAADKILEKNNHDIFSSNKHWCGRGLIRRWQEKIHEVKIFLQNFMYLCCDHRLIYMWNWTSDRAMLPFRWSWIAIRSIKSVLPYTCRMSGSYIAAS